MKAVRCSNGHWYDSETYSQCPHCGQSNDAVQPQTVSTTPKSKRGFFGLGGKPKTTSVTPSGNAPFPPDPVNFVNVTPAGGVPSGVPAGGVPAAYIPGGVPAGGTPAAYIPGGVPAGGAPAAYIPGSVPAGGAPAAYPPGNYAGTPYVDESDRTTEILRVEAEPMSLTHEEVTDQFFADIDDGKTRSLFEARDRFEDPPADQNAYQQAVSPVVENVYQQAVSPVAENVYQQAVSPVAENVYQQVVSPVAENVYQQAVAPVAENVYQQEMAFNADVSAHEEVTVEVETAIHEEMTVEVETATHEEMAFEVEAETHEEVTFEVETETHEEVTFEAEVATHEEFTFEIRDAFDEGNSFDIGDALDKKEAPETEQTPINEVIPQEPAASEPLAAAVQRVSAMDEGKTLSYFNAMTNQSDTASTTVPQKATNPVVGWLVAISGVHIGDSFQLYVGKNSIGRGEGNKVVLALDQGVSRDNHAMIIYEPKRREFYLQPGTSDGLVYLNDSFVTSLQVLKGKDTLEVGATKLMFIPLCGTEFSWEQYM